MIQNLAKHRSILISSILILVIIGSFSLIIYLANKGIDGTGNFAKKSTITDGAIIETNVGTLEVTFLKDSAPLSVNSFIELVNAGLYTGVKMSRLTKDFIQFSAPSSTPVVSWNETNKEPMTMGALSTVKASGGSLGGFFIVTGYSAPWLEGQSAVFARVVKGLDVLATITKAPKNSKGNLITPLVIKSITLK